MARDYKKEQKYDSKLVVKKKRANRNLARRIMERKGLVTKNDGKDVHHVGGNALNKKSKLKVVKLSTNRSYKRNKNAGKVNRRS
tara:strand:+ start:632 stop:883 length:252 start_codon:yes stop_codon:yes gene_type:complete